MKHYSKTFVLLIGLSMILLYSCKNKVLSKECEIFDGEGKVSIFD